MIYKDNYPNNIESPQRIYFQYAADITFNYSGGKYPTGNEADFLWEEYFTPIPHTISGVEIGPHVWNRYKIGSNGIWTAPNRVGGNIIQDASLIANGDNYSLTFVLGDGSTQVVDFPIPEDGQDGEDGNDSGNGLNSLIVAGPELLWSEPVLSHNNTYKHITTNGILDQAYTSNGDGTFRWDNYLFRYQLDDNAGIGDTSRLYSADKILSLFGSISAYGIRFVVDYQIDLAGITGMVSGDLAVLQLDTNRPVYRYDGTTWNYFFALDSTHNHNSLYTLTSMLVTPSSGNLVEWTNIFNTPNLIELTDISATSPISYDNTTGVITHDTQQVTTSDSGALVVLNGVNATPEGHVTTITTTDLENVIKNLELSVGLKVLWNDGTLDRVDSEFKTTAQNRLSQLLFLDFEGSGGNYGISEKPTRSDHYHKELTFGNGLISDNYNTSADKTIEIKASTDAEISLGSSTDSVITPAELGAFKKDSLIGSALYSGTDTKTYTFSNQCTKIITTMRGAKVFSFYVNGSVFYSSAITSIELNINSVNLMELNSKGLGLFEADGVSKVVMYTVVSTTPNHLGIKTVDGSNLSPNNTINDFKLWINSSS